MERSVKVKEIPATWILVNTLLSDEEVKKDWEEKQKRLNLSPNARLQKIEHSLKKIMYLKKRREKAKVERERRHKAKVDNNKLGFAK